MFAAIWRWLEAKECSILLVDPNGPTPESPLAAGSSGSMFISLLVFLFCYPQPSGKSYLNIPPGLSCATELAGQDPGLCLVRTLNRSSFVPRRAAVALVINKRFPSGNIFQSGLHMT